MDDAIALMLYAFSASIASSLLGYTGGALGFQLLMLAYDIFGSIIIGGLMGLFLTLLIKNIMNFEGRVLVFSLGFLFLSTGICTFIGLDTILAAMSMGFYITGCINSGSISSRPSPRQRK